MVDPLTLRRASFRALFVFIAAMIIFVRILPYHVGKEGLPAPDLLMALSCAWVLRRPDYVPVWLIACVGLGADILLMRPLGLGTLTLVLGTEFLRRRSHLTAEQPIIVEIIMVAGVMLAMVLAQAALLGVTMAAQPPVGAQALGLVITVAAYPVVVVATAFGFGVRPASPSDRDAEARI